MPCKPIINQAKKVIKQIECPEEMAKAAHFSTVPGYPEMIRIMLSDLVNN